MGSVHVGHPRDPSSRPAPGRHRPAHRGRHAQEGFRPVEDLGADIIEGVRGVKSKDGPDLIVWGSSTLTSVLLEQGLVDEVLLSSARSCWAGANASFRTVLTRANSLWSARRPQPQACS
jgi:dihydrofolate reductase